MKIDFQIDPTELARLKTELDPENVPKALSGACNKTLRDTKTFVVRTIRDIVNLKAGDIRPLITVKQGSPKSPGG
jgi:hypothetical protein